MKAGVIIAAGCLWAAVPLAAQTSYDVLEQDLQAAKEAHETATTQFFTSFLASLDAASQNSAQALELYKEAGGELPGAAPVKSKYAYETPSEKTVREGREADNLNSATAAIELHCGMMHYAALMTATPAAAGLQDDWLNWLKTVGEAYPQMTTEAPLRDVAMRDSMIGSYLGFHGWDDKEPSKWKVKDLPKLYHDLVLAPARTAPTAATLDMWDAYIAMRHADQPDEDKWTQQEEPSLAFDRGSDDFAIQPSMDKISTLMTIIKANPANPETDGWIARIEAMIKTLKGGKSGAAPVAAAAAPTPEPFLPDAPDTTKTVTPSVPATPSASSPAP